MNNLKKILVLFSVFSLIALHGYSVYDSNFRVIESFVQLDDSIEAKGLEVLESHMSDLKLIRENGGVFKARFKNTVSSLPCDYCEKLKPVGLDAYVFDASEYFPDGLSFDYKIQNSDNIEVFTYSKSQYRVDIPVVINFHELLTEDNVVIQKSRKSLIKYSIFIDYQTSEFSIQAVESLASDKKNILMFEFTPNLRVSSSEFSGSIEEQDYSSSAFRASGGISYYFNPFGCQNNSDIWLKAGLRIGFVSSSFELSQLRFVDQEIDIIGGPSESENYLDLIRNVYEINESLTTWILELPVGVSKRWSLSSKTDFSLEIEGAYNMELTENIDGDYLSDQLGTNHFFINGYQSASGGSNLTYDSSPQSIRVENSGELVNFYRNRAGLLSPNSTDQTSYFTFSLRPTIFIRKYEELKYQIGLNASIAFLPEPSNTDLDYNYFDPDSGNELPSIVESDLNTTPFYLGLVFGINL